MNLPLDFAISDIHTKNAALEQLLNDRQQTLRYAREQLAKTVTTMEKISVTQNSYISLSCHRSSSYS